MRAILLLAVSLLLSTASAATLAEPLPLASSDALDPPMGKLHALGLSLTPWTAPFPAPVPGKVLAPSLQAVPAMLKSSASARPPMRFTDRRVYMTGATGFIGGYVARRLVEEGAKVTCLVRPQTSAGHLERMGATVVRGDITNPASFDLTGQQTLIHCAAWVGYGLPAKKLPLFRRTNVEGTQNVLHAAERAGVSKVVHVSSIAAIGATSTGSANEETRRGESYQSEYERTKTAAHELALKTSPPAAIPMPGVVLGRGGPFDPLLRALARGKVPALPADDAVKGFVHVEDVAEGILLAALKGHGPYLLVDENMRTTELFVAGLEEAGLKVPRRRVPARVVVGAGSTVETLYKLVGKTPPFSGELLHGLTVPMSYDSSKARKELGWRPELVKRLAEDLKAFA